MKTINDPVHGHIELTPLQEALFQEPEVQRLAWISQLGMTKLIYPGATNTRLEHSLGVSYLAGEIADHLQMNEEEKNLLQAAGLLHDLGHPPFSHVLESLMTKGHEELTAEVITGKLKMPLPNAGNIPKVLKDFGIKPRKVADLVMKKSSGYTQQVISGDIDADRMDYLVRDAHYTGTTYGMIDVERTIKTMALKGGELVFLEKGLSSIEDFLIARNHMYSSVYIHHTVEIANKMLFRATQSVINDMPEFYAYTDWQMLAKLSSFGGYAQEMVDRITYRNLFKRAYVMGGIGLTNVDKNSLFNLVSMGEAEIEEKISEETGIKKGYVLADLNEKGLKLFKPMQMRSDIRLMLRDGKIMPLHEVSSFAKAILEKESTHIMFSVYSDEKDVTSVEKAVKKMLK